MTKKCNKIIEITLNNNFETYPLNLLKDNINNKETYRNVNINISGGKTVIYKNESTQNITAGKSIQNCTF